MEAGDRPPTTASPVGDASSHGGAPVIASSGGVAPRPRACAAVVEWGMAATAGIMSVMEDAMAVAPAFGGMTCADVGGCGGGGDSHALFFGVYDGHGGDQVAKYCARRVHEVVAEEWQRLNCGESWQNRWKNAFCSGFQLVDNGVTDEAISDKIGSTAVVVVVSGCQIISSNCGDSRAVLYRGNEAVQLTIDHKPDREDELLRIEEGGGNVLYWQGARVCGVLAMSRSIGDRHLRPHVIPVPEVTFVPRSEDDECIVLASDGLWDVVSIEDAGDRARRIINRCRNNGSTVGGSVSVAQAIANHLVRLAYKKGSSDNISVVVVDLKSQSMGRGEA